MKRYVLGVVLAFYIFAVSITPVFAFGGGSRGGSFGTGGFSSSTVSTQVTYEVLSELCTEINYGIVDGIYNNMAPFSTYPNVKFAATIGVYSSSESPVRYVIYVTYQSTKYYFKNNSGGLYWAYDTSSDSSTGKPFLDKLEAIRSQLVSANNTLTAINSKLTTLFGGFPTYVNNVTSWFTAQATNIQNIADRNIATYAGYTASSATWLAWTYKYVEDIRTYSAYLPTISSRLVLDVDGTTYSISNLVRQIWTSTDGVETLIDSNGIWLTNLTSASNWDTVEVTQTVANQMIAEINAGRHGNYGYFHNGTNYQYLYRPLISYAAIVNGEIRVAARNSSGNNSTMRLVTPNGRRYVVVDDPATSIDTSAIVNAINRIYNWLDNADLATNTTIYNVVQQNIDSAQDGVDIASQILRLFKAVFDFDRPGPNFPSVIQYFYNLGRDPT